MASQDQKWIEKIKLALAQDFEIKDFGLVQRCLGHEIFQSNGKITLSQRDYTIELLRRFGMDECKPALTPSEVNAKVAKNEETVSNRGRYFNQGSRPYRELIGALMYLSVGTRPDIANTVAKLAQFSVCPLDMHWSAAKRVLRYLKGTINYGLVFRKTGSNLVGFSDADWGGCTVDRRSFSGYAFLLGGAAISWKSQKQRTVSLSSTESEYISLSEATKEAIYLRSLMHELGLKSLAKIVVNVENRGALYLANDPVHHTRTKHIDIRHHFIRESVKEQKITLNYLSTDKMIADILTKALTIQKHNACAKGLGLNLVKISTHM